jgi:hypothetical protein
MATSTPLHVVFTMDVAPAGRRAAPHGPPSWEASARTIDAFCTTLLNAGFAPTLFMTPEAAAEHAPMTEALSDSGVEVALLVHPTTLHGAGLKRLLGAYSREEQEAIVGEARRRFIDALGIRPQSVRSASYSANDYTFGVFAAAGFRQASTSSPGRRVPKHYTNWEQAATEPHFVSATTRLAPGDLSLLEVPVTTDATQRRDGIAPDLAIENGTLERWHAPLIEAQFSRHEAEGVRFRTLCFVTSSNVGYAQPDTREARTLAMLVEYLDAHETDRPIVPTTVAGVYPLYRELHEAPPTETR